MAVNISEWLSGLGFSDYAATFAENEVDETVLPDLNDADLKELGILKLGHRKKILQAIARQFGTQAVAPNSEMLPSGAEHRQVMVLYADISGFTNLSSDLGAERTHELLEQYFGRVDNIVQGYGGNIDKHIGDAVMAVFGAPLAHTNDAERAVRSAMEIHQAVKDLDPPITCHIGIASGRVVASQTGSAQFREYTVTGDTVNLAARLTDKARSGETLVSDALFAAVAPLVEAQPVASLSLKGITDPVNAWMVETIADAHMQASNRPFVGRAAELATLNEILQDCARGKGQVVVLRGEAGIGKTRLSDTFYARAQEAGFRCQSGLILDFGVGKGQDAIGALVRGLLDLPANAQKNERKLAVAVAISAGVLENENEVFLNDFLNLPQPKALRSIYEAMTGEARNQGKIEAITRLLRKACEQAAVLVRIEDAHWADPLELAQMAAVAKECQERSLIFVLTTRTVNDPLQSDWRKKIGDVPLQILDLEPLQENEALDMARGLDADSAIIKACIERSGGNPLFLEQLLRNVKISPNDDAGITEIPDSLQSVVQTRMDHLPQINKDALQSASVLGQRVDLAALRHVFDQETYTPEILLDQQLLRQNGPDYLFAHALVREGVYASLLTERRRGLHRRAAEWYAKNDPILHAQHLEQADDPGAPRAYLAAAKSESVVYRYERVPDLLHRGLEVARNDKERLDINLQLGRTLQDMGNIDQAEQSYKATAAFAKNERQRYPAWIGLAACARVTEKFDEAVKLLDRAESAAHSTNERTHLAEIKYLRGNVFFTQGRVADCLEQHNLSLREAKLQRSLADQANALSGLGDANYMRGQMNKAFDYFRQCVDLAREQGFGRTEVANRHMVGWSRLYMNQIHEALSDATEAIKLAATVHHPRAEMLGWSLASAAHFELGNYERAVQTGGRSISIAEQLGANNFVAQNEMRIAYIAFEDGDPEEANRIADRAVDMILKSGPKFMGPAILGMRSYVCDDEAAARQDWRSAVAILDENAVSHNYFWFSRFAIDAAIKYGCWTEASQHIQRLEKYVDKDAIPYSRFIADRGRALVSLGRGTAKLDAKMIGELNRLIAVANDCGLIPMTKSLRVAQTKQLT